MSIFDKKEIEKIKVEDVGIKKPASKPAKKTVKVENPCIKCKYKLGNRACLSCIEKPKDKEVK